MPKKQKSGLYRTKIKVGVGPDGKDIVKWISGRTKAELEAARREVVAYYIEGTGARGDKLFGEYAVEWYRICKEPHVSDSSRASYRSALNKYVLPAFGNRHLRAIRANDIQAWINQFAGKSDTSITLAATIMRGIFKSACADRLIETDPTLYIVLPKPGEQKKRRALTAEEEEKLMGTFASHPDGLYAAILFYLGVRPGEARGLQWGDLDFDGKTVHIQRDTDYASKKTALVGALKTAAANRFIPLPTALESLLAPRRASPEEYVLHGADPFCPISKASAERAWLRIMQAAGLTHDREQRWRTADIRASVVANFTPHYLRHNYITKCWEAGLDPLITTRIVGHEDYKTTANIYTHLSQPHIDQARGKIDAIFAEKPKVAQKLHSTPKPVALKTNKKS